MSSGASSSLTPDANAMLSKAVRDNIISPQNYNDLISSANSSPFFASELNAAAESGYSFAQSSFGTYASKDNHVIYFDQSWNLTSNELAVLMAHELGHAVSNWGYGYPVLSTVGDAIQSSQIAEGSAVSCEYIVARQLGISMWTGNSSLSLIQILGQNIVNVDGLTLFDAQTLLDVNSPGVLAAGKWIGQNLHPSTAGNLFYDEYAEYRYVVKALLDESSWQMLNVTVSDIDWAKVGRESFSKNGLWWTIKSLPLKGGGAISLSGIVLSSGYLPNGKASASLTGLDVFGFTENQSDGDTYYDCYTYSVSFGENGGMTVVITDKFTGVSIVANPGDDINYNSEGQCYTITHTNNGSKEYYDPISEEYVYRYSDGSGSLINNGRETYFGPDQIYLNPDGTVIVPQYYIYETTDNKFILTTNPNFDTTQGLSQDPTTSVSANNSTLVHEATHTINGVGDVNTATGNEASANGILSDSLRPGANDVISWSPLTWDTGGDVVNPNANSLLFGAQSNMSSSSTSNRIPVDPLVLDLNGDGVKLTSFGSSPVLFDFLMPKKVYLHRAKVL